MFRDSESGNGVTGLGEQTTSFWRRDKIPNPITSPGRIAETVEYGESPRCGSAPRMRPLKDQEWEVASSHFKSFERCVHESKPLCQRRRGTSWRRAMLVDSVLLRLVVAPYCRLVCMRLRRGAVNRLPTFFMRIGYQGNPKVLAWHWFDLRFASTLRWRAY
jgi:hypothetical protein